MHKYLGMHLNSTFDAPQDIHQERGNNLKFKGVNLKPCDNNIGPIWLQTDTRQAALSWLENVT